MSETVKDGESYFKRSRGKKRNHRGRKRGRTNISWHQKEKTHSLMCGKSGFLNLWAATKKTGHGRTSDDYQITAAECALSRAASKADQSDLVSELEKFKKIGCQ